GPFCLGAGAAILHAGSRRRSRAHRQPGRRLEARFDCRAAARTTCRPGMGGALVERAPEVRRRRHVGSLEERPLADCGGERVRARAAAPTSVGERARAASYGLTERRMSDPVRRIAWPVNDPDNPDALVTREWLVTNALGGYASGTVAGVTTRRYHGLLIAALGAPFGRTVMLTHVAEQVRRADGRRLEIGGRERTSDAPDAQGTGFL